MTGFGALELVARALALQVAAHLGGRMTGTRSAFTTVLAQPFGRTLLLVAAVGFSVNGRCTGTIWRIART